MASQVFSGTKNFSYTNNTGQNVRVVINYMTSFVEVVKRTQTEFVTNYVLTLNWAGVTASTGVQGFSSKNVLNYDGVTPIGRERGTVTIGRNLAFASNGARSYDVPPGAGNNCATSGYYVNLGFPTEIMLSPGQTFSAVCGEYNVVVIPENG